MAGMKFDSAAFYRGMQQGMRSTPAAYHMPTIAPHGGIFTHVLTMRAPILSEQNMQIPQSPQLPQGNPSPFPVLSGMSPAVGWGLAAKQTEQGSLNEALRQANLRGGEEAYRRGIMGNAIAALGG